MGAYPSPRPMMQPAGAASHLNQRSTGPAATANNSTGMLSASTTWSNVGGLNINIDNLSLSGKPKSSAPSMNQLASGPSPMMMQQAPLSPFAMGPSPPPMLIGHAAPASFVSATSAQAGAPPMMMNPQAPRPMGVPGGLGSPLHHPTNPYGVSGGAVSGFPNHASPMMMASPNGMAAAPATYHSAFGK